MYHLLGISVLAASFNSILLNKASIGRKEIFKFNAIVSLVWCIILSIINKSHIHIDSEVLIWGVLYGISQALFIFFKTCAMQRGSVAITTLTGNCSLLISIFVSMILWNEKVTLYDVVGLVLLLTGIFMCTYKNEKASYSSKWKYYVSFFFVFASLVGIIFKAFGKSGNGHNCNEMMLISALVMLICYCGFSFFTGELKCKTSTKKSTFIIYAVGCGILSCLYNRLNIFLAGKMDAIIFFPAFNGGVVILSALLCIWLCKDSLSNKQKAGILTGIIAICLIGLL